jgi:hypothetical protein
MIYYPHFHFGHKIKKMYNLSQDPLFFCTVETCLVPKKLGLNTYDQKLEKKTLLVFSKAALKKIRFDSQAFDVWSNRLSNST